MLSRSVRAYGSLRTFSMSLRAMNKQVGNVFETVQTQPPNEIVSGAPQEMATSRVVRIYRQAKPATQSSNNNGKSWLLDWDVLGKGNRWENDLMGYQGSADYMQGTIMKFDTKEAAIRFAQGQGWDHYIQEPKERHFRKKEYATNFIHSPGPLKLIRTK